MSTARERAERELSVYTKQEVAAGRLLYVIYWKYYMQYCGTANPNWDGADAKTKLVFIRTAKDTKFNG